MKTGRNDPCPCGSGKKYKHCCMSDHAADTSPGNPLTEAKAAINEFIEGKQFSSLDDLQAQVQSFYQQRNQAPLNDFQGLSPEQMYRMLYFPFDTPRLVSFPQVLPTKTSAPAINLFSLLAEAIGQTGVKSTATGNLPRNFAGRQRRPSGVKKNIGTEQSMAASTPKPIFLNCTQCALPPQLPD
jgi:hypothetical protein